MGRQIIDIAGERFGSVVAVRFSRILNRRSHWMCLCDCGFESEFSSNILRRGFQGCPNCRVHHNRTHGESSGGRLTPEYVSWRKMKGRCLSPLDSKYKTYGAAGIGICDEWMDFNEFLKDMGRKPSPRHTIDRIDGSLGYCKGNCRWATPKEQSANRRTSIPVNVKGIQFKTLTDACARFGVNYDNARRWYRSGRSINSIFGGFNGT